MAETSDWNVTKEIRKMSKLNEYMEILKSNYADKELKGLYDAQPGDVIEIGIQGTRTKCRRFRYG